MTDPIRIGYARASVAVGRLMRGLQPFPAAAMADVADQDSSGWRADDPLLQATGGWQRHLRRPDVNIVNEAAAELARVCHEANRAICEAFGDHSQKPWTEAEQWQKDSAIKGAIFAMQNSAAPPSVQHEAWMRDKAADGWVYGPVKDAVAKTHPCMVPYDQLPPEQRVKDYVFKAIVNTLTRSSCDRGAEG